ncbi:ATP-binding protein [Streptomyces sp. A3M-1-3]|uniref:ATP-binding protein n=1 Tax=Streptomyces sp. A3M-1-3 TaxID=2962044 RepID=UPI0020B681D1|nr:ATP-binding protein [Streptomyces sp. A3M-1-3]MCP3821759.1 ATP-binding protein [Streptomyces sp. A3M-1-3]
MTTHNQPTTAQLWRMQFTSTPKCVPLVRKQVGKQLVGWGYSTDDTDRVLLVCSELATNAVQHGHSPGHLFEVFVSARGSHCLIEVSDASRRPPQPVEAAVSDEHGRGLLLVATLAEETGHRARSPIGKTVWARLLLNPPKEESDT